MYPVPVIASWSDFTITLVSGGFALESTVSSIHKSLFSTRVQFSVKIYIIWDYICWPLSVVKSFWWSHECAIMLLLNIWWHSHGMLILEGECVQIWACDLWFWWHFATCSWELFVICSFAIVCVPAFVLNHAEVTHFRPEYVSYMQKSLRQLMNQSKMKFTGQLTAVTGMTFVG